MVIIMNLTTKISSYNLGNKAELYCTKSSIGSRGLYTNGVRSGVDNIIDVNSSLDNNLSSIDDNSSKLDKGEIGEIDDDCDLNYDEFNASYLFSPDVYLFSKGLECSL